MLASLLMPALPRTSDQLWALMLLLALWALWVPTALQALAMQQGLVAPPAPESVRAPTLSLRLESLREEA